MVKITCKYIFIDYNKGKESFSFEYEKTWLANNKSVFIIDPDLSMYSGRQFVPIGKSMFGIFADSSPDRWGRVLMQRRERIYADKEGRKPRKLTDGDYLLGY